MKRKGIRLYFCRSGTAGMYGFSIRSCVIIRISLTLDVMGASQAGE